MLGVTTFGVGVVVCDKLDFGVNMAGDPFAFPRFRGKGFVELPNVLVLAQRVCIEKSVAERLPQAQGTVCRAETVALPNNVFEVVHFGCSIIWNIIVASVETET